MKMDKKKEYEQKVKAAASPACGLCFDDLQENEEVAEVQCKNKHLFKTTKLIEWVN